MGVSGDREMLSVVDLIDMSGMNRVHFLVCLVISRPFVLFRVEAAMEAQNCHFRGFSLSCCSSREGGDAASTTPSS